MSHGRVPIRRADLDSLARKLRRDWPPKRSVTVRLCPGWELAEPGFRAINGDSRVVASGRFVVRIGAELPRDLALEVLLHEWAHLLTWFLVKERRDHSPRWAAKYAELRRWFQGEDEFFHE